MGRKKTHEEFVDEFNKIFDGEYVVLSQYKTAREKVLIKHDCGREWWVVADSILHKKTQCPSCSSHKTWTEEEFENAIYNINKKIMLLDKYKGSSTKMLCECKICKHQWRAVPHKLLEGKSCPKCANVYRHTTDEYIQHLKDKNIFILPIDEYKTANTKILHRCLTCNHQWRTKPANVLNGYGCPCCASSKGEKAIIKYLTHNNVKYQKEYAFEDLKSKKGYKVRFDFGILNYKNEIVALVEYDGIQHFQPTIFAYRNDENAQVRAKEIFIGNVERDN